MGFPISVIVRMEGMGWDVEDACRREGDPHTSCRRARKYIFSFLGLSDMYTFSQISEAALIEIASAVRKEALFVG